MKSTRTPSFIFFIFFILSSFSTGALAAEVYVDQGLSSFNAGSFHGTVLSPDGTVRVGPGQVRSSMEKREAFVVVARDQSGAAVVGSAKEGKIFRFAKGTYTPIFESANKEDQRVTAIASVGSEVWAAFAPSGRLIRIDKKGAVHEVDGVKASYIWRIVPAQKDHVWVTTGLPGAVFKLNREGQVREKTELGAEHVMDVATVGGRLWVATAVPGTVMEVRGGAGRVIFDLRFDAEVHRIVPVNDGAYVITNPGVAGGGVVPKPKKKLPKAISPSGVKNSKVKVGAAFGLAFEPEKRRTAPKGAMVWRVEPGGVFRGLAVVGPGVVLDAAPVGEGDLLVSLSKMGRVLRVHESGGLSVYFDGQEAMVSSLALDRKGNGFISTAGGASLYRLSERAKSSTYQSQIRDGYGQLKIGRVDFTGRGIEVEVRTGSTSEYNKKTWTSYKPVPKAGGVPRVSPGRFLQYRVKLRGEDASLTAVRIAYQPTNLAPYIHAVHVEDRKVKVSHPILRRGAPRARFRGVRRASKVLTGAAVPYFTGIKRIAFDVQDMNGDVLSFHVRIRRLNEELWVSLTPSDGISLNFVDWKVSDFPDGRYEVEVRATDERSHMSGEGASHVRLFGPVLVDNSAPLVREIKRSSGRLKFRARDDLSALVSVEIAVNDGPWRQVVSTDGIVDGLDERFSIPVKSIPGTGVRMVRIRAEDSFGHQGVSGTTLR